MLFKKRKLISTFLIVFLVISVLLVESCAKNNSANTNKSGSSQESPTVVTIFTEFNTPQPPNSNNAAQKEIEKRTNTKLNIMWASANNFKQKENVILASGNIPDLMKIVDGNYGINNTQFIQMAKQGAFWDLGPYLKDYKNLMLYPEAIYNKCKLDGKQYLLPSVRPLKGTSYFAIRKDWVDKLNLKVPETIDDLYNVLNAFKNNDPDGNGKNDTIPWNGWGWSSVIDTFNASTGKYKVSNDELVNTELSLGTRQGLEWLAKAYKDKLMDADFSTFKKSQAEDLTKGGNCGMGVDTVEGMWRSTEACLKINPKADFLPLNYLTGPNGKYAPQGSGMSCAYAIPKTVSEKKMKSILALMDFGASDEGFTLACWGVKDVDYTEDSDGFKTLTAQGIKDNIGQSSYGKIFEKYDKYLWALRTGMPKSVYERNKKIIDVRSTLSIPDPTVGLVSETGIKLGSEYNQKANNLKTKIIIGSQPIEAWDKYVEQLKSDQDYLKIDKEYNDAYQAKLKQQ